MRDDDVPTNLGIDSETLAYIILKARAFDMLTPGEDTNASDAADDRFVEALEDRADNPVEHELNAAISGLDRDAQTTLVALTWLGRGDYEAEDWAEAKTIAQERAVQGAARYLLGSPMLGDLLEEGAAKLGVLVVEDQARALSDPRPDAPRLD